MTELRAAIDRERKIRHWTIPQLRDEFGADWPAAHANAVRAADNAVDGLFEQLEALREVEKAAQDLVIDPFGELRQRAFYRLREALASSPASEPEGV